MLTRATTFCRVSPLAHVFRRYIHENVRIIDKGNGKINFGDLIYLPNFITLTEQEVIVKELDTKMKRMKWEKGHWDSVIVDYREISKSNWMSIEAMDVIKRTRALEGIYGEAKFIPQVHAIELNSTGRIDHHFDNYCGSSIVGISMLSTRIIEFKNEKTNAVLHMKVDPLSLYVMKDTFRYDFTHAVLGGSYTWPPSSSQDAIEDPNDTTPEEIQSERRFSLMFRTEPPPPEDRKNNSISGTPIDES